MSKTIENSGYALPPEAVKRRAYGAPLRESEGGFQEMFEDAPVACHEIDGEGTILRVNRAECALLGFTQGEMLGRRIQDFMLLEEREHSVQWVRKMVSGERVPVVFERRYSRRDGTVLILEIYPKLIRDVVGRGVGIRAFTLDVTERRRTGVGLKESLERYGLVLEATHDGIFDHDLVNERVYFSPHYKEMLGFREEELSNETSSFFNRIHPDDLSRIKSELDVYFRDKACHGFSYELRLRHKDGTYRWVVSRGRLVRDLEGKPTRVVGSIQDITERYRAAEKLAASEQRLRDILDSQFGFVGLYALDGTVLYVNRAPLELAGLEAKDVLGKRLWETYWWSHSLPEQERLREFMARAARGEVVRFESSRIAKGGQQIVLDATYGPLRDRHGEICNIIGFGVDITKRKEIEAELSSAKQVAEAASRAKSEFLANMSHEIRTPMNAILGFTGLLLDSELSPEHHEYLGMVKGSAESLLGIISDILDMAKIQAGKYVLRPKEFWLKDVVNSRLNKFAAPARENDLRISSDFETGLPAVVLGDADCLGQVLGNLLDNAIKFTPSGEIEVRARLVPDEPELVHFTVRDTGVGISPEMQQTIFEPFSQVNGSSRRQYGGTGLGLAISSNLVELMGGRMWVESDGKSGSVFHFTIRLPAAKTGGPPPQFDSGQVAKSLGGANDPGRERRRQPRFAANDAASIELVRPFSPFPLDVWIVNVSKTGLGLRTRESLEPGTLVRVHLQNDPVVAEVRYCHAEGKEFCAGIEFDYA